MEVHPAYCEGTRKKSKYNDRITNIERGSFTPLVFTTNGGMGAECEKLNKRLAELIAIKSHQNYSQVIADIRRQLHFALLKATVIAVRGYRGGRGEDADADVREDAHTDPSVTTEQHAMSACDRSPRA